MTQNELYHYGVIGMKWGVHRGRVLKAYSKGMDKQHKLDVKLSKRKSAYQKAKIKTTQGVSRKYIKLKMKADKKQMKADKKKYGLFSNAAKAEGLQKKADVALYKANKYKHRHEKIKYKALKEERKYLKARREAEKWARSMDKTFRKQNVSQLNKEYMNSGKDFVKRAL